MERPKNVRFHILAFCVAVVLGATTTFGEEFWESRDYSQWTESEVRKMISDSPWAKDVTVNAATAMSLPGRGTPPADAEATSGGGRGGRGRGGAGGGGGGEVLVTFNISWRSSLPLRKALVKSRQLANVAVPTELLAGLALEEKDYIIVVSGIPMSMARALQDPGQLKQSVLKRGKKQPIAPTGVEFQPRTQSMDFIFVFPKTDGITQDDKEVEVVLKLGPVEAKRKFNLKKMVYNGKLEL